MPPWHGLLNATTFGPMCFQPFETDVWDTVETQFDFDVIESQLRRALEKELSDPSFTEDQLLMLEDELIEDIVKKERRKNKRKSSRRGRNERYKRRRGRKNNKFGNSRVAANSSKENGKIHLNRERVTFESYNRKLRHNHKINDDTRIRNHKKKHNRRKENSRFISDEFNINSRSSRNTSDNVNKLENNSNNTNTSVINTKNNNNNSSSNITDAIISSKNDALSNIQSAKYDDETFILKNLDTRNFDTNYKNSSAIFDNLSNEATVNDLPEIKNNIGDRLNRKMTSLDDHYPQLQRKNRYLKYKHLSEYNMSEDCLSLNIYMPWVSRVIKFKCIYLFIKYKHFSL